VLEQLTDLENRLTDGLGPHTLLVGHETTRGVRTIHVYSDSDDPLVAARLRTAVSGWPGATVTSSPDPGWRALRALTG
jgi:hypothetical protein